ncbi:MAG: tripartite tricarboxylate transporter substrate binding protein [Rhodospirillales bacterium]|nr:tripartite tricarboxylate transporter substrate binding protein [Rhodospirillales bacterium]MBO6788233.1 tripartite tricarboxylate transporter substrate binding protein [Rhodospirillales bacterium]
MKSTYFKGLCAAAAVSAFTAFAPGNAHAAPEFSCSTAKLIVPWKAGGGTAVIFNIFENIINNELKAEPKIQVVTISGQGGNKGAKEAKDSKPDGCTLFAIHQSAIVSYLNGRVDFTWDAFDMVAQVTSTPEILGASGKAPWKDFAEFKKFGVENPGEAKTGATFGSTSQFMWLLLEDLTGMKFKYVPFDGTRERMTALLSNTVDLGTINVASGRKYIESGELKAYAIADDERSKFLPDLPTLKELGVDMNYALVRGVVAPKGTPADMVEHWSQVFKKAAENENLKKQLDAKGTNVKWLGPKAYAEWFKKEYDDHERVAIKIGMYKK